MLTAEGCKQRRQRLWARAGSAVDGDTIVLQDLTHLRYFANFYVSPYHFGGESGGVLVVRRDGSALLIHGNKVPPSVKTAHADEIIVVPWYDGQSPANCPRPLALLEALKRTTGSARVNDSFPDPLAPLMFTTIADMRRAKDPDEVSVLRRCMAACEAGHAWALANIRSGMTELDVYAGVNRACLDAVGDVVVVYGDFAISPGPERHGGGPTRRVLQPRDMFILDYSVVISGYRSDFTNTLVVDRPPTADQRRLFDLCVGAMRAGEDQLRAGVACQVVYDAVHGVFAAAGMAEHFPHHAGHGLGLQHPEAPYLVRLSTETLMAGDVVTLEPGLYVPDVGGIRIEHDYLITDTGFDRLSNHAVQLSR